MNTANSGGMLVADTVRLGMKAKLEGSTSGQRWRVIDMIGLFSSMAER